jgi:TolB-like protein/Tfp pilus assembly protein PilF
LSLFTELKRRNVLRVAIAYVAVSWLLIQVVETVFPLYGLSDGAIRLVISVLAIGFIPVLVVSWVFELTPEGLKRDADVDHSEPGPVAAGKRFGRIILVMLALALGYFAFDKFVLDPARDAELVEEIAEQVRTEAFVESYGEKSIAVLPFVNMSSDPEQAYFSDGIAEELLNLLARIPELRVTSRSSSFMFRGDALNLPEVAAKLNVAHILEGSVRKAGNRVRITAQLIEARSDTHLWLGTYDRELDDIFTIQDEISAAIVVALKKSMGLHLGAAPAAYATASMEAHEAYLRGRYLIAQRTPSSEKAAVREFAKAVSLDPEYALAYAELSLATRRLSFRGEMPDAEAVALATPHAERAMALDPTLAQAHAATGYVWVTPDTIEVAISHFRRAIELNPNYSDAHLWLGNWVVVLGQYDENYSLHEKAVRLDPLSRPAIANYAGALIDRNRLDEADRQMEKLASIAPGYYAGLRLPSRRRSFGGRWADGLLAGLDSLRFNRNSAAANALAEGFATVGLEKEALALFETPPPFVFTFLVRPAEEVAAAEAHLAQRPDSYVRRNALTLARAGAGQYTRARAPLEQWWQQIRKVVTSRFFTADTAMALIAVRRDVGDEAGIDEMHAAIRDNVRRYHEAGITGGTMYWNVDYEEGIFAFLAGDRDKGLASIAKSVEYGYFIRTNAA